MEFVKTLIVLLLLLNNPPPMNTEKKAKAWRPCSAGRLKMTHDKRIVFLENESVDAICRLYENSKDTIVFKEQMKRLAETVVELNSQRYKSSLLATYFLSK